MHTNHIKVEKAIESSLLDTISGISVTFLIGSIVLLLCSHDASSDTVRSLGIVLLVISGGVWYVYGMLKERFYFKVLGVFLVCLGIGSFIL